MTDSAPVPVKLTPRQRFFIEAYLKTWNASEAARQAGYTGKANVIGPRLLAKISIKARIAERLQEMAMGTDEVLERLAEHARGDMDNFLDISSMGYQINLSKAKELGLTRLIHKVKQHTTTTLSKEGFETETSHIELELYDAQAALVHLGKHLNLFGDQTPLTGEIVVKVIKGISLDEI